MQAFNHLLRKDPPPSVKTKKEKFKDIIKNIIGVSTCNVDTVELQHPRKSVLIVERCTDFRGEILYYCIGGVHILGVLLYVIMPSV